MKQPMLYMIAGPNGAGKTTAAMELLPRFLSIHEFVNADEIARGLNPLDPSGQNVAAGRLMLNRIDDLIVSGKNFAFETTGASRAFAEKMKNAKNAGYRLGLLYLWLPSAEFAKHRVRLRVRQGGHSIPDHDIERRFGRSLCNLIHLYLPLVDEANIYDSSSSGMNTYKLIAGKIGANWAVIQSALWTTIEQAAGESALDKH